MCKKCDFVLDLDILKASQEGVPTCVCGNACFYWRKRSLAGFGKKPASRNKFRIKVGEGLLSLEHHQLRSLLMWVLEACWRGLVLKFQGARSEVSGGSFCRIKQMVNRHDKFLRRPAAAMKYDLRRKVLKPVKSGEKKGAPQKGIDTTQYVRRILTARPASLNC